MPRARRTCNTCPTIIPAGTRKCPACTRTEDQARGTSTQRGYTSAGHRTFRVAVLRRDRICVECREKPSTVADHHPHSRRQLVDAGLNPDDPARGRGLCKRCHDHSTSELQPGGWNVR